MANLSLPNCFLSGPKPYSSIYHVRGKEVLRYTNPRLDPKSKEAKPLLAQGANLRLSHGHIALQAEAQRVWFRNIQILPLD